MAVEPHAISAKPSTLPKKQFYRRELPSSCIDLSSPEGKTLFAESLSSGHTDCYFKLASQFRTQDEPAFCGLSSLIMVLNSLDVDPGRVWKGPWRWYHEQMLDCCVPLQIISDNGIDFSQFKCLADCNSLDVHAVRCDENATESKFREVVKEQTAQDRSFIVATYSRKVLQQTGDGHFSPIGGYHPGRDLVLILDTARFKYPPHWVPLTTIWQAMQAVDKATGKSRGYFVLSRMKNDSPLLLFQLADQFSVTLSRNMTCSLVSFLKKWNLWLTTGVKSPATNALIEEALGVLEECLHDLPEEQYLFSTKIDIGCLQDVSQEHMCSILNLITEIEKTDLFAIINDAIDKSKTLSDSLSKVGIVAFNAEQQKCPLEKCPYPDDIKSSHFVVILLLSWPYNCTTGESTNNQVLCGYVKGIRQSNHLLGGETGTLERQIKTVVKIHLETTICKSACECKH